MLEPLEPWHVRTLQLGIPASTAVTVQAAVTEDTTRTVVPAMQQLFLGGLDVDGLLSMAGAFGISDVYVQVLQPFCRQSFIDLGVSWKSSQRMCAAVDASILDRLSEGFSSLMAGDLSVNLLQNIAAVLGADAWLDMLKPVLTQKLSLACVPRGVVEKLFQAEASILLEAFGTLVASPADLQGLETAVAKLAEAAHVDFLAELVQPMVRCVLMRSYCVDAARLSDSQTPCRF